MVKSTKKEEVKEEVKGNKGTLPKGIYIPAQKEPKAGDEAYIQSEHTVIIKGN